jgi:diguanylate cyclase (GGDEF)-like protein/PAS domain S-box-containing protein
MQPSRNYDVNDTPGFSLPTEPEGPGRDAIDVLYRIVAALDLTPTVAVHSIDQDGLVRFWNKSCVTLYGVEASDALGHPLVSMASRLEHNEEFADTLADVWKSGKAQARDWHIQRRDGQERWVYSSHYPVARDGVSQQVFCMEVDISKRKVDEAALIDAGATFRRLFQRSDDAMVLIKSDTIIDANPSALRLFGSTGRDDLVGKTLLDFSPATQPSGEASLIAGAANYARNLIDGNRRFEWLYQLPDGKQFWAEVLLISVTLDQQMLSYAVLHDISKRKQGEQTMLMAAQVFSNCRNAILVADNDHTVLAVNQAYLDMTGYQQAEVVGARLPLRGGLHDAGFYQQIWDFVEANDHWEGEVTTLRRDGTELPVWVGLTCIRDAQGAIANYMLMLSDISERKLAEERTRHLAEHDFLTDLPNRVLFLDRLQQALAAARRKHGQVAVMFLDLDRFKGINDSFGHATGDAVLKEVAQRLTRCVRSVDTVSRLGGDEFVVILAEIGGVDQAAHVATTVMHAVAQPVTSASHTISLSVSIGVAIYPADGADVETLLQHADVAMYHAKQNGRNAFSFFDAEMNAHVIERVELENKLRQALLNGEFELAYQPEINIASGQTTGVEALLRWRHPQRGLLLPDQFIQVAEECGLIVPIGEWVLREACLRARNWHDCGFPVVVSVNLSSLQFSHNNLIHSVDEALRESGLDAASLDLEFCENVIMNGQQATIDIVNALRERGVQLTIDDFGTGYSSLSTLRRFPLSKLKIDRSFIDDITNAPADAAIIPAIIAVARSLKLRVIAEGVETAEQLRYLRLHGCDDYQGHYADVARANPDLRRRH